MAERGKFGFEGNEVLGISVRSQVTNKGRWEHEYDRLIWLCLNNIGILQYLYAYICIYI